MEHLCVAWNRFFAAGEFLMMRPRLNNLTCAFGLALLICAPAARAGRAYVSNEDDQSVSVIDTDRAAVVGTVEVGKRPRGLKLSPDGAHLYVAVSGMPKCGPTVSDEECARRKRDFAADGIADIDTATLKVSRMLQVGTDPEQFDVSADGRRLFISNEDAGTLSVFDLQKSAILSKIPVGKEPEGARVGPDGKWVLVTSEVGNAVTILDTRSFEPLWSIAVGKRPRDAAFTPDGKVAFITCELDSTIYRATLEQHATATKFLQLRPETRPMGVVLDTAKERLYISTGRGGTVAVVKADDGKLVSEVPVGPRPWGIAMSADGSRLYTANGPSNDVTIIDTSSLKVLTKVAVGKSPWGVVVSR
jgi:PQQ-dependent catabolism-associated beta-propeller protein